MNKLNKFRKEDGSFDIKQITELPIEERMRIVNYLSDDQYHQYIERLSLMPINEGIKHTEAIIVDYSMEDEIKRGTSIDIEEYLAKKRKELGLKS